MAENQEVYTKSLLKSRSFIFVFLAGMFAMLGYSMYLITVSWYVINELNSPSLVGLTLLAATIPRLTMMIFSGALSDKYKKTTIMFITHILQAAVLFCLYLLLVSGSLTFIILLLISALFGFLDAFFGPASSSLIPKIIHKSLLQKANAFYQGGNQVMFIIGPIIAGVVMESASISLSYLIAALFVLLSGILIYPKLINEPESENQKNDQGTWEDIKDGIRYVNKTNNLVIGILIFITLELCVIGPLEIGIPLLVKSFNGTPIQLSLLESGLGVGMVIGSAILSIWVFKRNRGAVTVYGLLLISVFMILFSLANSLLILILFSVLIGFSAMLIFIPFYTIAQESTRPNMMGRVMSIVFLASHGFNPVAFAIITPLAAIGIDIQAVMLAAGIVCLIAGIIIFFNSRSYQKF
ncbi:MULTISPECIES: MFS transporter [Bacillus]|uniref:MFS transporter n=1 Tax=Bacillus TaxID=1386 RepID=UPI000B92A11B|nr:MULTISPECIES: MFS transporter [Bacillus]ASS69989.1 MFS transporter [Bacillus atrophaeus]MCC2931616.1 MFS transporter [Bacillus sp. LBG-1-113]